MTPTINAEQRAALEAFAKREGRYWKRTLRDLWFDGKDSREPEGPLLRQVRNLGDHDINLNSIKVSQ